MKIVCLVLAVLFFFSSCYSTPRVSRSYRIREGSYSIRIASGYTRNPHEFKYAINSFVRGLGETSYDLVTERHGRVTNYTVNVPGSQQVENMQRVRHFHRGKTAAAIVIPIVGVNLIIGGVIYVAAIAAAMSAASGTL